MDDPVFGELLTEVNEELAPFRKKVVRAEEVRCALALARQKRIGAAERAIRRKHIEGIGEMVARIDADLYHRLGLMHGYETVRDPDFLRILLRDNPDCRVESRSARVTVRVTRDFRENSKFEIGNSKEEEPRMDADGHGCADACTPDTAPAPLEAGEMDR